MKVKLQQDSVIALKEHNQALVDVLRYLIALIDKRELQLPPGSMNEGEELKVLLKELKNKEESRELFVRGNRDDLVMQLDYEIKVLKGYLPADMSQEELERIVDGAVAEVGKDFGAVMKGVMVKVAGRISGDKITPLVKKKLSD